MSRFSPGVARIELSTRWRRGFPAGCIWPAPAPSDRYRLSRAREDVPAAGVCTRLPRACEATLMRARRSRRTASRELVTSLRRSAAARSSASSYQLRDGRSRAGRQCSHVTAASRPRITAQPVPSSRRSGPSAFRRGTAPALTDPLHGLLRRPSAITLPRPFGTGPCRPCRRTLARRRASTHLPRPSGRLSTMMMPNDELEVIPSKSMLPKA